MKMICVADADTCIMFGLIGIKGVTISDQELGQFKEVFEPILEDEEIGFIIMNEKILLRYKNYFQSIKSRKLPIIVEIPDIKAPFTSDYFNHFIKENLGLNTGEI